MAASLHSISSCFVAELSILRRYDHIRRNTFLLYIEAWLFCTKPIQGPMHYGLLTAFLLFRCCRPAIVPCEILLCSLYSHITGLFIEPGGCSY